MRKLLWNENRKWASLLGAGFFLLAVLALVASSLTPNVRANAGGYPLVLDRDSIVFGRSYADWSAAWEQWAFSIPTASHPLFDHGDCSTGQSGPVWFLGGKFCANNDPTCGTSNVVRTCKVASGKALYVAIFNSEDSALEDPGNPQIAGLRAFTAGQMDSAANLTMEVDGLPVPHLKDRFRVQSTAFGFTLPDDNYLKAVYPPGYAKFDAGSYFPGVDDGYYAMLPPLDVGHHTLHFHGFQPQFNFTLDITYHVYVYH